MKDKMKNIHILTTDKPSRLYLGNNGNFVFGMMQTSIQSRNDDFTNKNIYITSDEEIKDVRPHKGKWQLEQGNILNKFPNYLTDLSECKLVIMTTDQDLIKDGVQAIDDEFLEWFVKNPSCEGVEVESGLFFYRDGEDIRYKIIIPKQEPKKVLTEEDIFNQKDIDAVTDYINKEQQKQHLIDMMESDEELGLYDESREIKLEDIFNEEKKEKLKKFISEHKKKDAKHIYNRRD